MWLLAVGTDMPHLFPAIPNKLKYSNFTHNWIMYVHIPFCLAMSISHVKLISSNTFFILERN